MYEGGDLERMLRICKVRGEDFEEFREYVAFRLLTHKGKVQDWKAFAFGIIRTEYYSRHSRWWKEQGRWSAQRTGLQELGGEIPEQEGDSRVRHLGDKTRQHSADVQGAGSAERPRPDNLLDGGGAWHNSGDRKKARSTPQHDRTDLQEDRSTVER